MERGEASDACKAHLEGAQMLDIRQTRKGWCQEIMGCEARTVFNYFDKDQTKIATSIEDTDCFCRVCCAPIHPFTMAVKEVGTEAELLTVDRPCACAAGSCKCCCYQTATITSGGKPIGEIVEGCYYCVPTFTILEGEKEVYKIHPPTCCGGMCFNCFTEGNPCGKGCCKVPFWIFDANEQNTDGENAPKLGKILKKPKSLRTELFTDANAFEVSFPNECSVEKKALLVGGAIFLNAVFFEGDDQ